MLRQTNFPPSLFLQNRKSTTSTEKAAVFHSHQNISFIFKKPNQHSQRLWFQCKLHVLILFKVSSGNYWTSSPPISQSMCQVYTGVTQEYIAISNTSVVGFTCVNTAQPIYLVDKVQAALFSMLHSCLLTRFEWRTQQIQTKLSYFLLHLNFDRLEIVQILLLFCG